MYPYHVKVQFEDIDSYGIIHNPRILYFLERARTHFFLDNGINVGTEKCGIVLRNINIQFKSQILMFDDLIVEVRTKDIDKYKFTFDYKIKRDDKVMVKSQIEIVTIDLETKKLAEIPPHILRVLKKIEISNETA